MNRIRPLDGLRAFAVLGVIWIHCWILFGNVPLSILGVNFYRTIAIVGNGVDFFFVISGFCIYLMFTKKYNVFSIQNFLIFIWSRWKRIAPAFYAAVVVSAIFFFNNNYSESVESVLVHFVFMHTIIPVKELAPPFWSLATEWHFYMVLPILLWFGNSKKFFNYVIGALMILSFIARIWLYGVHQNGLNDLSLSDRVYIRFIEFSWGILVCRSYVNGKMVPRVFSKLLGFAFAFLIAYTGRILMTTEIIIRADSYGYLIRAFAEPIMTFGFSMMVWNVVSERSIIATFLNLPIWQFVGKVSYSMYLWHWIVVVIVSDFIIKHLGKVNIALVLCFLISLCILMPISWLSYRIFEQPYFRKSNKHEQPGVLVASK